MNTYDPRRKNRTNRARERQLSRDQRRKETAMAVPHGTDTGASDPVESSPTSKRRAARQAQPNPISLWLRDALWYITHRPKFLQGAVAVVVVLALWFVASHMLSGRIFPNIWVMGIHLGEMTVEEAELAIMQAWTGDLTLDLYVDDTLYQSISPSQLGVQINAASAAEEAKAVGMAGIPFSYTIEPALSVDYQTVQNYLLAISQDVNLLPYNAGYELSDAGVVIGVAGRDGRELDITSSIEYLQTNVAMVAASRRLDLRVTAIPPTFNDPAPHLETVQNLVSQQFALVGYDPFTDTKVAWSTRPQEFLSWIEAGNNGLTVRRQAFRTFIEALNKQVSVDNPQVYIDLDEAATQVANSLARQDPTIHLRLKYYPDQYTVGRGDTGFRIARKTGIPFYMIQEANPSLDWEQPLYPGDVINLPSKDKVIPEMPIPHKRIVVDLDKQYLVAFENGNPVFEWAISSGIRDAPTYPGVYQILSHSEIAYGSSYTLCNENQCGQWKMYWFMGIYEIQPGLMNGFHGAVELPNGAYLGGNSVGQPYTFGCVMSMNDQAEQLYAWSEKGTIVEIVSSEYAPQSELAKRVYYGADTVAAASVADGSS